MLQLIEETYVKVNENYGAFNNLSLDEFSLIPINEENLELKHGNDKICNAQVNYAGVADHWVRFKLYNQGNSSGDTFVLVFDPVKREVLVDVTIKTNKKKKIDDPKYSDMIDYASAFGVYAAGELLNYNTNMTTDNDKEALKKCENKFADIDDNLRKDLTDIAFGRSEYNSDIKKKIRRSKK